MLIEKDFFSASKILTVVEGDVSYPYIEISNEERNDVVSFEIFTKEKLDELINYLQIVKERWN